MSEETQVLENVIIENLGELVPQRFLNYAMYVAQDRAIPDGKDGLTLAPLRSNSYSKLL